MAKRFEELVSDMMIEMGVRECNPGLIEAAINKVIEEKLHHHEDIKFGKFFTLRPTERKGGKEIYLPGTDKKVLTKAKKGYKFTLNAEGKRLLGIK